MSKFLAACLIVFTGFCTRPPVRQPQRTDAPVRQPQQIDVEPDRYAVYSALLTQFLVDEPAKVLVIQNETEDEDPGGPTDWSNVKKELAPASQPAVDDFKARNVKPSAIENKFSVPAKVMFISKAEVERLFAEGGGWWEAFYKQYPKSAGLVTFSNVGFNPEMNYALVYFGYGCGGLCGRGGHMLLIKKEGKWTIEDRLSLWVS
jgi:hypothetical protein